MGWWEVCIEDDCRIICCKEQIDFEWCIFFLMIRRPPRSTLDRSSAASYVYKRQDIQLFQFYHLSCVRVIFEFHRGLVLPDVTLQWQHFCSFHTSMLQSFVFHIATSQKSHHGTELCFCLLYTSPSPRDRTRSRMPSSAWKKKNRAITAPTTSYTTNESQVCSHSLSNYVVQTC